MYKRIEFELPKPDTEKVFKKNFMHYVPALQAYAQDIENSPGKEDEKGRIPMPLLMEAAEQYCSAFATNSNAVTPSVLIRYFCYRV